MQAVNDDQGRATEPEANSLVALPSAAQEGTTAAPPVVGSTETMNPSQVKYDF